MTFVEKFARLQVRKIKEQTFRFKKIDHNQKILTL